MEILLSLLFTLVVQFIPICIYRYGIRKEPLSPKRAKRVSIIYEVAQVILYAGVLVLLFSLMPTYASNNWLSKNAISLVPFLLYGYIIYRMLKAGYNGAELEKEEDEPKIVVMPDGTILQREDGTEESEE